MLRLIILFLSLLLLLPSLAVSNPDFDIEQFFGKQWFGIYVNDHKIGYLNSELTALDDGTYLHTKHTLLSLMADSTTTEISTREKREYSSKSQQLLRFDYSNTTPTGEVIVTGILKDDDYQVSVITDGFATEKTIPAIPIQTLEILFKPEILALENDIEIGDLFRCSLLEIEPPLIGQILHSIRLIDKKEIVQNGVKTRLYTFTDDLIDIGIQAELTINSFGDMLQQKVPSMNMALKAEPERIATQITSNYDIIEASIIPVNQSIINPYTIKKATYTISGFRVENIPESDIYDITELSSDSCRLTIDISEPDSCDMNFLISENELSKYLEPTELIQSNNPEIKALANELTRDAAEIGTSDKDYSRRIVTNYL